MGRLVRVCVPSVLCSLLLAMIAIAQSTTIRPTNPPPNGSWSVTGINNPSNAVDANEFTAASGAQQRHCHIAGVGTSTLQGSWWGFAPGFAPQSLTVKWTASADYTQYAGGVGYAEAFAEYSLDNGGAWTRFTNPGPDLIRNTPGNSSLSSSYTVTTPLSLDDRTPNIRVRLTHNAVLTYCPPAPPLNVTHTGGILYVYDVRVATACQIPTGETTTGIAWNSTYPTAHDWRQTLTANGSVNFSGRVVTEQDPGNGGPDTCYFNGSAVPESKAITGGAWNVGSGNVWGDDTVGWLPAAVTYYRQQGRAPCDTQFQQRMVIDCAGNNASYITNTLRMGFDSSNVWSERAGVYATRAWP